MNAIITREYAIRAGMTAAQISSIADWHMHQSEREFDRHDIIAFRLFKLANSMR